MCRYGYYQAGCVGGGIFVCFIKARGWSIGNLVGGGGGGVSKEVV